MSSVIPVRGWVGPGLTVRCSVDGWIVVVGCVVVPVGSVCWVSGLHRKRKTFDIRNMSRVFCTL